MAANIKNFVLDASFLLSVLLPDEQGTRVAKESSKLLIDENNIFFAPRLLEFEVLNSIKSAIISKRIKKNLIGDVLDAFEKTRIKYLDIDKKKVLNLSIKKNLTFYDASYLYLAKTNKAKLLTLDKKLKMLQ